MTSFTFQSPGVTSYASPPSIDSYTKPIDSNTSDRIGELQKFLLGSDWSSLSSLSPPTAPVRAIVDDSTLWSSTLSAAPLFPSSVETIKPMMQTAAAVSPADVSEANDAPVPAPESAFAAMAPASVHAPAVSPAAYESSLTPPHRHSLDTCYSDSVGSPDSERDFLTSPSMFDDADFEFDTDNLANNFPLFTDQSFEDVADAHVDDPISAFASTLENVKLEAGEQDSQLTETDLDASQSTVMPSQSQIKTEQDIHDSTSTLEAAFKTESGLDMPEPKHEQDVWSAEELKPYFGDDETKSAVLSTLANAFASSFSEPIKASPPAPLASESISHDDEQHTSQAGPIRSARGNRERRSSPIKLAAGSASASPAPVIDPITKAKRWQCLECGKWFDRAYNLKTHRYTHEDPETRARPFICPDTECQKQFARKHDMQRHFENVHRGESRRGKGGSVKRSRADDLG